MSAFEIMCHLEVMYTTRIFFSFYGTKTLRRIFPTEKKKDFNGTATKGITLSTILRINVALSLENKDIYAKTHVRNYFYFLANFLDGLNIEI